ncbi:JAB domain-containing protein [Roseivirga sp. BDSF3-8]|uniref:JAB domain-containing protein n=1 Tax=Roseivirga sp. BDSF3-8 TaxID=3241598 RepID=UPI003532553A
MDITAKELSNITEIKLSYSNTVNPNERPQINNSWDAYQLLLKCWDHEKIEMVMQYKVLLMNTKSRVLGLVNIASGSAFSVPIDYKQIFAATIKSGATSMIVAYNHPSGDSKPDNAEIAVGKKLENAAKLLDIRLLDNLIITLDGYYSFQDEGITSYKLPDSHLDCKG